MVGDTQLFKVFSEDRVQQVLSRSLIFPVEVFIAQDRVHLLQMGLVKGFFALFPKFQKSATLASHSGSALLPESSPSTPAAQLDAARVSAGVPSLAPAVLASADDTVDASALAFLSQRALGAVVEAEEEMVQGLEMNRDVVLFTGRGMVSVHDGAGWSPRGTGDMQLTWHSSGDATFLLMDEFREVLCYCYVVHSPLVVLSRRSVRWRAQLCTDDEPVDAHILLLCVSEELLSQFQVAYESVQAALPDG